MKRDFIVFIVVAAMLIMPLASAAECNLDVKLINQDPYPAIQGDYVKVVFQVTGVNNPSCKDVTFGVVPEFPFSLDPGASPDVTIQGGAYSVDYNSFLTVPYKLRVDRDAIDGNNLLKTRYSNKLSLEGNGYSIQKFNVSVQDVRTDFEVSVKDYDSTKKAITFQILNIGKYDIEALTIDLPNQDNFKVIGSNRNIVGSLSSNDDTTFTFEGTPDNGVIKINITYTDKVNTRRTLEKVVDFDSTHFAEKASSSGGLGIWFYLFIILLAVVIFFWWRGRRKRKKEQSKD